jgi:hypothetical protein
MIPRPDQIPDVYFLIIGAFTATDLFTFHRKFETYVQYQ